MGLASAGQGLGYLAPVLVYPAFAFQGVNNAVVHCGMWARAKSRLMASIPLISYAAS